MGMSVLTPTTAPQPTRPQSHGLAHHSKISNLNRDYVKADAEMQAMLETLSINGILLLASICILMTSLVLRF